MTKFLEEAIFNFKLEVSIIRAENTRRAVRKCLEDNLDEFSKLPSSLSGKYHPKDERDEYGMIKHSKRVVTLCLEMTMEFKKLTRIRDEMVVAAIFHDIGNINLKTYMEKKRHPEFSVKILRPYLEKYKVKNSSLILGMIENHMSHWYGRPEPTLFHQRMFCVCDYIASRRYIKIPFFNQVEKLKELLK